MDVSSLNKIECGRPIVRLEPAEYRMIEDVFLDYAEDYGFVRFPISPREFARRAGVELIRYSSLARADADYMEEMFDDGYSAMLKKSAYCIAYNDGMPKPRERFTLWYELAHICLGHVDGTSATTDRWKQKAECNAFARFALAPIPFVIKAEPESPADIARWFGVSHECAGYVWGDYRSVLRYPGMAQRLLFGRIARVLAFDVRKICDVGYNIMED